MRVRAAGSSGVTTVNAVQTTVKGGGGGRNQEMTQGGRSTVTGSKEEIKNGPRYGQKKNGQHGRRGLGEKGRETINTQHRDAASIN